MKKISLIALSMIFPAAAMAHSLNPNAENLTSRSPQRIATTGPTIVRPHDIEAARIASGMQTAQPTTVPVTTTVDTHIHVPEVNIEHTAQTIHEVRIDIDAEQINLIRYRYRDVRSAAQAVCTEISGPVNQLRVLGGIATAANVVGGVAGVVGTGAMLAGVGIQHNIGDRLTRIAIPQNVTDRAERVWLAATLLVGFASQTAFDSLSAENFSWPDGRIEELKNLMNDSMPEGLTLPTEDRRLALLNMIPEMPQENRRLLANDIRDMHNYIVAQETAGTVHQVSALTAGGTQAVGAGVALGGAIAIDFDALTSNMNECEARAYEIQGLQRQLMQLSFNDPLVAEMGRIVDACRGFSTANIDTVRRNLTAGGIISVIGAAAGITAGVAVARDESRIGAGAATVLTGASAVTGITSAILTGSVARNLNRNREVAEACENTF